MHKYKLSKRNCHETICKTYIHFDRDWSHIFRTILLLPILPKWSPYHKFIHSNKQLLLSLLILSFSGSIQSAYIQKQISPSQRYSTCINCSLELCECYYHISLPHASFKLIFNWVSQWNWVLLWFWYHLHQTYDTLYWTSESVYSKPPPPQLHF